MPNAGTVIAHPDGHYAISTTGNPGMATGGMGDALAGMYWEEDVPMPSRWLMPGIFGKIRLPLQFRELPRREVAPRRLQGIRELRL